MAKASGASSASQHALGTAVVGGALSPTCLAIFFVPLFYVLVAGLFKKEPAVVMAPEPAVTPAPAPDPASRANGPGP